MNGIFMKIEIGQTFTHYHRYPLYDIRVKVMDFKFLC